MDEDRADARSIESRTRCRTAVLPYTWRHLAFHPLAHLFIRQEPDSRVHRLERIRLVFRTRVPFLPRPRMVAKRILKRSAKSFQILTFLFITDLSKDVYFNICPSLVMKPIMTFLSFSPLLLGIERTIIYVDLSFFRI